jgi:hypothetical protein
MEDEFHRLLTLLTFYYSGYGYLSQALIRLPWEGPLAPMTWAQITHGMDDGDFKLLIVTGYQRMVLWMNSVSHSMYFALTTVGTDIHAMCAFGTSLLDRILSLDSTPRGLLRWEPNSIFTRKVYPVQELTEDELKRVSAFHYQVGKIVTHRALTARLRRKFVLHALIPTNDRTYGRLA